MTKSPITFQRLSHTLRVPLLVLGAVSRAAGGAETTQTGATPPTSGVAATRTTAPKKVGAPAVSRGQSAAVSGGIGVTETNLDAVTVVAPDEPIETAWGPSKGYVARESSTATKTDTPLIETPASVSVITDDRMQGQKGQSIETLLNYTAGVRSSAFGFGSVYSGYLIRGYQPSFFQLFRDSLVQYGQMQPEPYGLERIEVLRGPASVLYGEGSPGGLVNMVTKRPTDVPHYEVEMNGGSWGFVQGMADLSGSLDSAGDWRYRFTTKNRNADTQMDFVPDNRVFMAPALTWQPSEDTSLTVLANFQKDTSNFTPYLPAQGTLFGNPNGQIPTSRYIGEPGFDNRTFTTYSLGYLFEHRFNDDLKIRQNVRYMSVDIDYRFTFGFSPLFDNFTTVERESDSTYRQVGVFALDNQLQYKWDLGSVRQTILAGVNYNEISDNFRGSFWLTEPLNVFRPVYGTPVTDPIPFSDNRETVSQIGLYFQDQIKIDDHWIVMGGGRQDFVTTGFRDGIEGTASNQNPSAFTGRAGLMYLFDIGIAPYFSYSEAFSPVPGADRSNQPFQPERSFQYEVGVKYEPVDWKALFTLALFDLNRENALAVDPVNPNFEIQTGKTHTQGVEVEGVMTLTDGLNLIANYTYLNPRNVDPDLEAGQGPIPQDVPKNMGSIWAQYEVQGGVLNGLGLGAGMHYTGTTYNFDNALAIPDYTIMDAMLYYQLDNWRFQVNANNILDKTYVAWCGDETSCSYGQRRFILASVRYTW